MTSLEEITGSRQAALAGVLASSEAASCDLQDVSIARSSLQYARADA
jgi:hypothetical protein